MSTLSLVLIVVAVLVVAALAVLMFSGSVLDSFLANSSWRHQMRAMSSLQHTSPGPSPKAAGTERRIIDVVEEDEVIEKIAHNDLTLRKKLKYAQLTHIPPFVLSLAQILISLTAFLVARQFFDIVLQFMSLMTGPLFVGWLLNMQMERRFNKFDADYPQFLLSLAGLLKTGLNPIQGLQAAAEGLEETSLVRAEVQLMLERLRLGVPEERSVGSFGEDVNHPEIELFVQALILSRRVGGNLSDTLDRLSKQVRKRQYFRKSAVAAVGLQRGSIIFILFILVSLEVYLFFAWRECVVVPWTHPLGRTVCQAGLIGILLGLLWVRQVTKIKV
jgi:Flp pilus assembly protein TadB